MSLLDSDDDPYAGEDEPGLRGEPLVWDGTQRGRAKRSRGEERRGSGKPSRGEDKRGSSKPVHWSKRKENVVQERTPKKGKGQGSGKTSVSRTPPDSPKGSRPAEVKAGKGGVAVGAASPGLQPSPNIKSHRKRYSQLEAGSSSSEEELAAQEGSLFSNKPALRGEGGMADNPLDTPSNPFLEDHPIVPGATYTPVLAPLMLPTGAAILAGVQQQAWLPAAHQTTDTIHPMFLPELSSPVRQYDHTSSQVTGAVNPLLTMGEAGGLLGSPPREGMQDLSTNPFLSTNQFAAMGPMFTAPPPPTTAPPTSYTPEPSSPKSTSPPSGTPTATPLAEDWSISEDLHGKCVLQFNSLEPVKGILQGDKAREFFIQSKLPNQELSAIW